MKKVERKPLSEPTLGALCSRTLQVANAGHAHTRRADRARARRAEALRLWDQKKNKAFDEIRGTLRAMAPGPGFCMYCEFNVADAIDHFWPKSKYPWRAFFWENYLWSCSVCNTTHKKEQFPLDRHGKPLLINPADEDPREHLELTPRTGKYIGRTPKGDRTIQVLGFDRRGDLDNTRRAIWLSVQLHLICYGDACARGDWLAALDSQKTLCSLPHASVLFTLMDLLETPGGASCIENSRCIAVVEAYPDIRTWV